MLELNIQNMIEVFVLSIIQGVTEFLPISSSSHIILTSKFLNFTNENLLMDVSLHIGSFIAVLFFFHIEILNFFKYKKLFILIILSSLPVIILGYFVSKSGIINDLRTVKIIGWTTLFFGILLYFSDKQKNVKNLEKNFDTKSAIIIGFLHAISLIPGVSRSGIAITAARFLNFERVDAAKISFLLSIPTLFAVGVYGMYNVYQFENLYIAKLNFLSIFLSFVFSYLTMKLFLDFVKKSNLLIFVVYRIFLGIILLFYAYQ